MSLLSASSNETLHYFRAYGAFIRDVGIVRHFPEVSEAVFALGRSLLVCVEQDFALNQFRIAGILHDYFDF